MKQLIILAFILFQGLALASQTSEASETSQTQCDKNNYKQFVNNQEKMNQLIQKTGKGCQFEGDDLSFKVFSGAYLPKANFKKANMQGVEMRGAVVTESDFSEADLRGAILSGMIFPGAMFTGAKYNESTKFPILQRVFNPKKRGMVFISWFETK